MAVCATVGLVQQPIYKSEASELNLKAWFQN
jgi:hypothetical protein